jgi:acetolactate synthase I/II/III large subunit
MIRLADYVTQTLVQRGYERAFVITGGLAMHLNDAIAGCEGLAYTCCHHEQASSIAAETYARIAGKPALLQVTGGPGGINALNGVFGAYTDSVPMLVITGQAKRETLRATYGLDSLRQLGDQEVDIIAMARGVTKYAVLVQDPSTIRYHLERAIHLATHGRPGPCWLDLPVDVQSAMIEPDALPGYDPAEDAVARDEAKLRDHCAEILRRLATAERPVILVGSGVHVAGARDLFQQVAERLGLPVALAFTAPDARPTDHPLNVGRPGTVGDRAGNFAVQNADALLVLGSRLNIRQVSYNWANFARGAYKMQVDVDPAELAKPTVKPDLGVCADLRDFLRELLRQADETNFTAPKAATYLAWCRERVRRYPGVSERQRSSAKLNPYPFIEAVMAALAPGEIIVCGDATANIVPQQVGFLKKGMRLIGNSGCASMGYDLPAAIGASLAAPGRRVVCFAGDGSAQFNIQELQTMAFHRLPIKIFILNNAGYLSMRLTQGGFFKGNFIGEAPRSGVSFPDYVALAAAYGLPAMRIDSPDFAAPLAKFLAIEGPALCEVMLDPAQEFEPKLTSRRREDGTLSTPALDDMAPFLSREELAENRLAPPA